MLGASLLAGCAAPSSGGRDGRTSIAAADNPHAGEGDHARTPKSVAVLAAAVAEPKDACPAEMVSIEGRYCIDRYEASLVETLPSGEQRRFSPFATLGNQSVRAVSEPDVFPQGYVSAVQAKKACIASNKRLCNVAEWQKACRGPENKRWGYGEQRERGKCNDNGKNPILTLFGFHYDASTMNQPQVNQLEGTLAKTGSHAGCSNGYGVYDMVGNLHEWIADANGTFYGGYYQDVSSFGHGEGCEYRTTAHAARYHDYSTGFRCCADVATDDAVAPKPAPRSVLSPRSPKPRKTR